MNYENLKSFWEKLGFRARLILSLCTLFSLVLTIGYFTLYREFQIELQNEFDRSLYNYAADLLENVKLINSGKADVPLEVIFSPEKVFPFPHGNALVKIFRFPFREIFSFSSDKEAPSDLNFLYEKILRNEDDQFFDLKIKNKKKWRCILMQLDENPIPNFYFFVAVPRDSLTAQENKFKSIFIAGEIIILIISALMISFLATSMLRPLENLKNEINEMPINHRDHQFKIPKGPPEINLLAKLLNKLLMQVRQSLVAHQDFVAKAAHQLKTPLTIAKGHLEQLTYNAEYSRKNSLNVAIDEIDLMSGTINNLLNLVQIESGFQNIHKTNFSLLDLILTKIDRLDYLAKKKNIKFQIKCTEDEGPQDFWQVESDIQLVSIILNNILENALKYSSESPIELSLFAKQNQIITEISNKTELTAEEFKLLSVSEKFMRGKSMEGGHGLGLYISFKIASVLGVKFDMELRNNNFVISLKWIQDNKKLV